jgi:hypothetical protein
VEDSSWKANHVLDAIARNGLAPETISEIGCGAGAILSELQNKLPESCTFMGYEFAPQAFAMCAARENASLRFSSEDGLASGKPVVDLSLALDVLEHVDDYPQFLRTLGRHCRYAILHVPLDLSLLSLLTGLPQRVRRSAGHLHYFTRQLALDAVTEAGFEVLEARFTRPAIERPNHSWRGRLARLPRLGLALINEDLAALLFGGFSLLIVAKPAEQP